MPYSQADVTGYPNHGADMTSYRHISGLVVIIVESIMAAINLLPVFVVTWYKRKSRDRISTDRIILSLSITDILSVIIPCPFAIITLYHRNWSLGYNACAFYQLAVTWFMMTSLFLVTYLCIDRLRIVQSALNHQRHLPTSVGVKYNIFVIYLMTLAISCLPLVELGPNALTGNTCQSWLIAPATTTKQRAFYVIFISVGFLNLLTVIVVNLRAYFLIRRFLEKTEQNVDHVTFKSSQPAQIKDRQTDLVYPETCPPTNYKYIDDSIDVDNDRRDTVHGKEAQRHDIGHSGLNHHDNGHNVSNHHDTCHSGTNHHDSSHNGSETSKSPKSSESPESSRNQEKLVVICKTGTTGVVPGAEDFSAVDVVQCTAGSAVLGVVDRRSVLQCSKMVLIITLVCYLAWLPALIMLLLMKLGYEISPSVVIYSTSSTTLTGLFNPIIYCIFSTTYRHGYRKFMSGVYSCFCWCLAKPETYIIDDVSSHASRLRSTDVSHYSLHSERSDTTYIPANSETNYGTAYTSLRAKRRLRKSRSRQRVKRPSTSETPRVNTSNSVHRSERVNLTYKSDSESSDLLTDVLSDSDEPEQTPPRTFTKVHVEESII